MGWVYEQTPAGLRDSRHHRDVRSEPLPAHGHLRPWPAAGVRREAQALGASRAGIARGRGGPSGALPVGCVAVSAAQARPGARAVTDGRRPARFEQTIDVQPEDIDEQGHVNNVVYLRWVQDVAGAHWNRATSPAERAGLGWGVLRHEVDHKLPAPSVGPAVARTWAGANTAATSKPHVELLRAA